VQPVVVCRISRWEIVLPSCAWHSLADENSRLRVDVYIKAGERTLQQELLKNMQGFQKSPGASNAFLQISPSSKILQFPPARPGTYPPSAAPQSSPQPPCELSPLPPGQLCRAQLLSGPATRRNSTLRFSRFGGGFLAAFTGYTWQQRIS
jgi:hypothetical protein